MRCALRRSAGGGLDDDAALLAMARQVLAGPADGGRASYQVSLTVCSACGQGNQLGGGKVFPVAHEVVDMAECDGQHIGQLLPWAEIETDASDPAMAAPANDVHVGVPAPAGQSPDDTAEARAPRATAPAPPIARAKQSIPPAVRRAVLARDQHRCRVPGCTHVTFLDVHHLVPRSEGGSNDPENTITRCGAHHRAAHRGEIIIEPSLAGSPTFRQADGSKYGHHPAGTETPGNATGSHPWWAKQLAAIPLIHPGPAGRRRAARRRDAPRAPRARTGKAAHPLHDLRATFVTLALAAGRSEMWVADRTGHRSSIMINRYRRAARTATELNLGELV